MDIKCQHCGTEYDAEENECGSVVKCEICGKEFVVGHSFTKKLGEATAAMKDAARIAAHSVCEKARNIDWKAQGDRAREMAGSAYNKGKAWYISMRSGSGKSGLRGIMVRFWEQLACAPWTIQFASVYVGVFGLALSVCNLATSKPPSSYVQSFVIVAIAIAVGFVLVRFNFVRWLLVAWGGLNLILLICGSKDFACFWPVDVGFILIAILLVIPATVRWYKNQFDVDHSANYVRLKIVFLIAMVSAIITGIVAYECFGSEQMRIRSCRGTSNEGTVIIEGLEIEKPMGVRFERVSLDSCVSYRASLPCECDDAWDGDSTEGPSVQITFLDWKKGQTMKEFLRNLNIVSADKGWKGSILKESDDEALLARSRKVFGRSESTYEKIILDRQKNRLIAITGSTATGMCVAAAKRQDPIAVKIQGAIIRCVDSARLCR